MTKGSLKDHMESQGLVRFSFKKKIQLRYVTVSLMFFREKNMCFDCGLRTLEIRLYEPLVAF